VSGACSGSTTRGVAASHFFGLLLWIPINRVMFRGEDEGLTSAEGDRLVDEDVRACLAAYRAQTRSRATARGSRTRAMRIMT
jgi:AefR-like transcriptional repressor, C-terminal domain